ncbi:TetR/AcrR family transcriptional regulator [Nakamurella endophytica]|uniref:TetR/AcrR family transcriptional regulator n=1 Tax=Nakamurella endophytica TaxID=1748367 RepID=UPI00166E3873
MARRTDAVRNRRRLLDVATTAFATGSDTVSLESIAQQAGVGIGTLYRHFPSRQALVEAVYRAELAKLCADAEPLSRTLPAERALRTWLGRYADFVTTKRGMAETLREIVAGGVITPGSTRAELDGAVRTLLSGTALRQDVDPQDVIALMAGVMMVAGGPATRDQADRMLDLLVDGLRAR